MSERKTAMVTGGSRGIGRAIAAGLGGAGFNVVINYNRNCDAADEAARGVEEAGGKALAVQADVASVDDHARLLKATLAAFGSVDLLVNNAGVAPKVRTDVLQMTAASYDFVMDTNLRGPFLLTQRVANWMVDHAPPGAGHEAFSGRAIVNIGSMSAYTAHPSRGEYSLSKAGMAMMTQVFAARLAEHGINVYEVRPGVIATDMTGGVKGKYDKLIFDEQRGISPIRRWGTPQDVARAVALIAEGGLPFSTGEVINVDGGFHMKVL